MSVIRYQLVGYEEASTDRLSKLIKPFQSKKFDLSKEAKAEVCRWSLPPLGYEISRGGYWDMSHCILEEGYCLRMRIERRKVSSELMQLMLKERVDEWSKEHDKKPSRPILKQMREDLHHELLNQTLPMISHVDALWHDNGQVYLFTSGKKNKELFEALFTATFAKKLECSLIQMQIPYANSDLVQWQNVEEGIEALNPFLPLVPSDFRTSSAQIH